MLRASQPYEKVRGSMQYQAPIQHWRRGIFALAVAVGLLLLGCRTPADSPEECDAVEVPADESTQSPRPDASQATFHFPGNNPEQREFVLVHEDGRYDYAERWNFGVPKKGTVRSIDPRVRKNWEDDVPLLGKKGPKKPELEELQNGIPPRLQREWDDELQATFGWDWKVGCEMHVCTRDDGEVCCHQQCDGGGSKGTAYEPPDHFACMNSSAGGHYDWFLTGLRDGGMSEVAACVPH
jgi:hypothetical protein